MSEHMIINQTAIDAGKTFKAYQLEKPGVIRHTSMQYPVIGPDEVIVRLEGCGVCASSLPIWEGRSWFKYPVQPGCPGHEGYGIVEETGDQVTSFKKGDRVTGLFYQAFAEFDKAKESELVRIPTELTYMHLPGEPLGCAMNIIRRSNIQPHHTVAVVGAGFIGLLLIQLIKQAGAKVIAISKRKYSRDTAAQFGADEIVPFDHDAENAVASMTGNMLCDRVIETTGTQEGLNLATKLTCINGRLVIAGYHQDGLREVNMQEWNWKGLNVINAHEREPQKYVEGMQLAIDALASCTLDVAPLFTHYYSPDKLNEAFQAMHDRPDGFIKAIVLF